MLSSSCGFLRDYPCCFKFIAGASRTDSVTASAGLILPKEVGIEMKTSIANSIDASEDHERLDAAAKRMLRHKLILAWILKECVEEFSGYDVKYIEKHCFVGDVHVSETAVDQDVPDADAMIAGSNTEDISDREGAVYFDILFDAVVPDTGEQVCLIINVEVQVDLSLKYPLIMRTVYYLGRLISRQKGTVFTNSDYGRIRKVYSIWICPAPKRDNRNSLVEYGFAQQKVIGKVDEPVENYDKMKAIMISLGDIEDEGCSDIGRLLGTLFSESLSADERKRILEREYQIPMTRELEAEVREMCNYSLAVEQRGVEKGIEQGIEQATLDHLKSLKVKLSLTTQQALDALSIPKKEQKMYAAKL